MTKVIDQLLLQGVPISRGIAIGKPYFFVLNEDHVPDFNIPKKDVEKEVKRYLTALANTEKQVRKLQRRLKKDEIQEGALILDAQLEILHDPLMTDFVVERIRRMKKNAESVFFECVTETKKQFQSLDDPFFRERFKDIQDISDRVMSFLCQTIRVSLADIPPGSIVFSRELSPSCAAEANPDLIVGFVTETGGNTSHAAVVAKARGIPYVSHVSFNDLNAESKEMAIVDGRTGKVILNPDEKTLDSYREEKIRLEKHMDRLLCLNRLPSKTKDGISVGLKGNIDSLSEVPFCLEMGGEGVGLVRTEYLFLQSNTFPTFDEQFAVYKEIAEKMQGRPVVIRTFDFGQDKARMQPKTREIENPYVGSRTLHHLLLQKTYFQEQVRAILKASRYGKVSLLLPMVTSLSVLQKAKFLIEQVRLDMGFWDQVPIGCMIEVPSAAIVSDLLAKESDFLSIGTNDLVQYSLALNRSEGMSSGFMPLEPSILRLIKLVTTQAAPFGIPVSVCGEIAADPRFAPLLVGLGVTELSCAPRMIPSVKNGIRSMSIVGAYELATKALALEQSEEIEALINREYQQNVPDDCFYHF